VNIVKVKSASVIILMAYSSGQGSGMPLYIIYQQT